MHPLCQCHQNRINPAFPYSCRVSLCGTYNDSHTHSIAKQLTGSTPVSCTSQDNDASCIRNQGTAAAVVPALYYLLTGSPPLRTGLSPSRGLPRSWGSLPATAGDA